MNDCTVSQKPLNMAVSLDDTATAIYSSFLADEECTTSTPGHEERKNRKESIVCLSKPSYDHNDVSD